MANINGTNFDDEIGGSRRGDVIDARGGFDTVFAWDGNDEVYGGSGWDDLFGEDGNDTLDGGTSDDYLEGGRGNDRLLGGDDQDLLGGGRGADTLIGGNGDDGLYGDAGNDRLEGGSGFDILNGGTGNDALYGGTGEDGFVFRGGFGDDRIFDFSRTEGDTLALNKVRLESGVRLERFGQLDSNNDGVLDADDAAADAVAGGGLILNFQDASLQLNVTELRASDFVFG